MSIAREPGTPPPLPTPKLDSGVCTLHDLGTANCVVGWLLVVGVIVLPLIRVHGENSVSAYIMAGVSACASLSTWLLIRFSRTWWLVYAVSILNCLTIFGLPLGLMTALGLSNPLVLRVYAFRRMQNRSWAFAQERSLTSGTFPPFIPLTPPECN